MGRLRCWRALAQPNHVDSPKIIGVGLAARCGSGRTGLSSTARARWPRRSTTTRLISETDHIVDDFVQATAQADTAQKEHDRQRMLRSVRKHRGRFGLVALTIEGDKPSIDAIYAQLRSDANRLYLDDGGSDVAAAKDPRTNDQRLFAGAHAALRPACLIG